MSRKKLLVLALLSLALLVGSAVLFACSSTPTSVPVRTFERAGRMDVVCMQLYEKDPLSANPDDTRTRRPIGRRQVECAPVPSTVDGNQFGKQLYAFVTQTTRGELAVVNLSAGNLVDQTRATPGVNFIPVGALPTDVATTPDGKMAFVAAAEVNKPAIYGIPTRRLLGDSDDRFPKDPEPLTLGSWPVCALPQAPGAIAVVPRKVAPPGTPTTTPSSDAGAGDAGDAGDSGTTTTADAGAPSGEIASEYDLVVVLPGDRLNTPKIVTIDPRPFRRGGLKRLANGTPDYDSDHLVGEAATLNAGPILEPGVLAGCNVTSAIELVGGAAVPTSFKQGPAWDDGVKYVDGGTDLTCARPAPDVRCGPRPCCLDVPDPPDGGATASDAGDAGVFTFDGGACAVPTPADAGDIALNLPPADPPKLVSLARDDQMLYVADGSQPLIHVLDMSPVASGGAPKELAPLLATSIADPSRSVKVTQIALSPPTRDYKRYLYAVEEVDGSIMVFDVTDPLTTQRTPLTHPHPELNPFQPIDRISFSAPVKAVMFARHDLPLALQGGVPTPSAGSGLLCNPNHNLDSNPQADLGFYYRANSTDPGADVIGPRRLRGIFAFATLTTGQVLTLDVDDWDSPCRRPSDMSFQISDVTPPEPAPSGPGDINPYHSPNSTDGGVLNDLAVTNEAFFPMTAPHSLRSAVLITDDVTSGNQVPRLQGAQTISVNSVILSQTGMGSENTPLADIRFARESPQVHVDQDWSVTFEGALPGFDKIPGVLTTDDNFESLIMTAPSGKFCTKGVEDWAQGVLRTEAMATALARKKLTLPARADRYTADYVQLTDDLLDPSDDYWNVQGQDCWDPRLSDAASRYDVCNKTFGAGVDQTATRDFPITEAFEGKVRLGRYFASTPKSTREVVFSDPSNAASLKLMKCCFHNQVGFRIRTGNLWSAVGTAVGGGAGVGFFSHLTTDAAGRCVPSCDPREALLNGRLPNAPFGAGEINRNSPLAMRNPMFDMRIIAGQDNSVPARDTVYTFSTRGGFQALTISITGGTTAANPASMFYVAPLGQMAVVDAASQGLTLIDLRAVTVARAPYF